MLPSSQSEVSILLQLVNAAFRLDYNCTRYSRLREHHCLDHFGPVFRWDHRLRPNGSTLVWVRSWG